MIERLTDMPPGTIGFRAGGEIEREDYSEVLVPELQRALESGAGLRTLYVIDELDEIEPSALWADAKLGFDLSVRHHDAWVRSAIVTDIEWMARATKLFAWIDPGRGTCVPALRARAGEALGGRGLGPQLTAFFTSAAIFFSSAAVSSFSAKEVGHMAPSSRFALSLKPSVAYLDLNFCALWKKQTTLPSLA